MNRGETEKRRRTEKAAVRLAGRRSRPAGADRADRGNEYRSWWRAAFVSGDPLDSRASLRDARRTSPLRASVPSRLCGWSACSIALKVYTLPNARSKAQQLGPV